MDGNWQYPTEQNQFYACLGDYYNNRITVLITRNKYPVYDGGALFFRRNPTKNMDNVHRILSSKNFCAFNLLR